MSQKEKTYLPQSGAGLIRYFDVEEKIQLKPEHIIIISVVFGGVVLAMKLLAA